jgi:5-(carboxyamino)imidazole ribonucleotide synthase
MVGETLGVVGGGQLGRMLAEAAAPLGVEVVVLDPTPDCPAATVADQIVADFDDAAAVRELADSADALTYEIELADPAALADAAAAAGVPVHPDPETLRTIQDKLVQTRAFADRGIPVPEFRPVDSRADLEDALDDLGRPAMLKARTGGYDGRGNVPVESADDAAPVGVEGALVEKFVEFDRELSVIGVRGNGERAAFPVVENIHEAEILRETVAPARTDPTVRERAREVALDVLDAMDGRGVFGIELFERDGEILVNEVAPRPHNSGHYSIEGTHCSQFEQHVRAVLGAPLGETDLRAPTAMANILGNEDGESRPADLRGVEAALRAPAVSLHWYGKREVRPLRKMGHVTAVARDDDEAAPLARARRARDAINFRHD